MKRDMECVRQILLKIEEYPHGMAPKDISVDGFTDEAVSYHIFLMIEAGLLEGADVTSMGSLSPEGLATRMTWKGHEFLDNARDSKRWNEAKKIIGKMSSASFDIWIQVLTQLVVKNIGI